MTTTQNQATYPHYRRNAIALALDNAFFGTGANFISTATVLMTFLATLTSNEVLIGAAVGLLNSAWLLPQLIAGSVAARQRRMKPMVLKAAWSTRPVLLPLALVVWLFAAEHPHLVFAATVLAIFCFFAGDAFTSVPWFSMLARVVPPDRRGRVVGIGGILGGLGGVGAGMLVRYVLADSARFPYPGNYGLLIAIGCLSILLSGVCLILVHEPEPTGEPSAEVPPSFWQVLKRMPELLGHDVPFRKLVITKVVLGFAGLAGSFYVLYATRELGFDTAVTGYFVTAQVIGSMGSGLLLSYIQDHWGPLHHMRTLIVVAMLPPLCALLAGPLRTTWPEAVLPLYLALYFFSGVAWTNIGWPFFNWILEAEPEQHQPLYIGLLNTISAVSMLAPTIGGLLVRTVSYQAAFCVGMGFAIAALVLSFSLPSPRHRAVAPSAD